MTESAQPPGVAPGPAFVALGAVCVVVGGFVAAFTGPLGWTKGSWAAAYLVLVLGVGQYVMGRARAGRTGPDPAGWTQLAGWNVGSLLVVGGTLVEQPPLVDLGSVCLVVALALALRAGLQAPHRLGRVRQVAYRAVLVVLLVSIPVGVFLSHARHG